MPKSKKIEKTLKINFRAANFLLSPEEEEEELKKKSLPPHEKVESGGSSLSKSHINAHIDKYKI